MFIFKTAYNAGISKQFGDMVGNPWLMKEIVCALDGLDIPKKPTKKEVFDMIMRQYEYLLKLKGPHLAMLEMRSHTGWYLKGMSGAAAVKNACNMEKDFEKVKRILEDFLLKEGKENES